MRFNKGQIYRHQNCLDMDIRIIKEQFRGSVYSVVKVEYIAQRNSDLIFHSQVVRIHRKDMKHWKLVV